MNELMHLTVWAVVVWLVFRAVWWSTDLPGKPLDYLRAKPEGLSRGLGREPRS